MVELIQEIDKNIFFEEVKVRFNNILNGFDEYKNITFDFNELGYDEEKIIKLIEDIYEENKGECYIDFYISKLSQKDRVILINMIEDEDREFINKLIDNKYSDCYFKLLSKKLIPIFMRLNTREIFFVTFYFTYIPITIWGNYNLKFPCFFDCNETMKFYERKIINY